MGCRGSKSVLHAPPTGRNEEENDDELTVTAVDREVPLDRLATAIGNYDCKGGGLLRVLRIEGLQLGDSGGTRIGVAIGRGRHVGSLECLRIAGCGICSLASLAEVMAKSPSLLCFDLECNAVRAEGVSLLAAAMGRRRAWGPPGSRLEVRLSENPIGVSGRDRRTIGELAGAMRLVPRRKRLALAHVGNIELSTEAVAALAAGRFETIDLRGVGLEDASELAEALVAARTSTNQQQHEGAAVKLARKWRRQAIDYAEDWVSSADEKCAVVYEAALRLDESHPLTARPTLFWDDVGRSPRREVTCRYAAAALVRASPRPHSPALAEIAVRHLASDYDLLGPDGVHLDARKFRLFNQRVADIVASSACEAARLDLRENPCATDGLLRAWPLLREARGIDAARLGVDPPDQLLLVDVEAKPAASKSRPTVRRRPKKAHNKPKSLPESTHYWLLTAATAKSPILPVVEAAVASLGLTDDEITFSLETLREPYFLLVARAASLFAWSWLDETLPTECTRRAPAVLANVEKAPSREAVTAMLGPEPRREQEQQKPTVAAEDPRRISIQERRPDVVVQQPEVQLPKVEEPQEVGVEEHKEQSSVQGIAVELSAASRRVARLLASFVDAGNDLSAAFGALDVSADGELSVAELHRGLLSLGSPFDDFTRADAESVFADAGGDHLTFDGFADFVRRARPAALHRSSIKVARLLVEFVDQGNDLCDALASLDASRDGAISAAELYQDLRALGPPFEDLDSEDCDTVVKDILVDRTSPGKGDERIELEDLTRFVARGRAHLAGLSSPSS